MRGGTSAQPSPSPSSLRGVPGGREVPRGEGLIGTTRAHRDFVAAGGPSAAAGSLGAVITAALHRSRVVWANSSSGSCLCQSSHAAEAQPHAHTQPAPCTHTLRCANPNTTAYTRTQAASRPSTPGPSALMPTRGAGCATRGPRPACGGTRVCPPGSHAAGLAHLCAACRRAQGYLHPGSSHPAWFWHPVQQRWEWG